MPKTIRQQLNEEILAQAQTILPANDYNHDLGTRAFLGHPFFSTDLVPCLIMVPGIDQGNVQYGVQVHVSEWECYAIVQVPEDRSLIPSVIEEVMGDLIRGIIGGRGNVSLAEAIGYIQSGPMEYPGQADQIIRIQFNFEVEFHTVIGDPYTQA